MNPEEPPGRLETSFLTAFAINGGTYLIFDIHDMNIVLSPHMILIIFFSLHLASIEIYLFTRRNLTKLLKIFFLEGLVGLGSLSHNIAWSCTTLIFKLKCRKQPSCPNSPIPTSWVELITHYLYLFIYLLGWGVEGRV